MDEENELDSTCGGKKCIGFTMTHIQKIFIANLRYYRTRAGFSQLAFAEKIGLSQNYLNAVENGKNFPSVEILQKITEELKILPYELFLESAEKNADKNSTESSQKISALKQKICALFDEFS
jgi:transcriptional regulator with XRE-family HTH domain